MCDLDRGEMLSIHGKGGQLDGDELVAAVGGHDHALRLAGHFDDDWSEPFGPVQIVFLHGWNLHLRVGPTPAPSDEGGLGADNAGSIGFVRRGCDGWSHSF